MAQEQLNIFLSASIPEERNSEYFNSADVIAIRDSVIALVRVALPTYKLIWGGHPSITKLVANVLVHSNINIQDSVTLYQSLYYKRFFPLENDSVANIILTPDMGDQESSDTELRERMIGENNYYAGIFVGGMEGVEKEFEMFVQKHPYAKVFPIASSGAAAKFIFNKINADQNLLTNLAYSSLFKELLNL